LTSIVVPTDFSPAAAAAVCLAGRLVMAAATAAAGDKRLDVHLLHIGWPWDRVDDSEFERLTLRPRLAAAEDVLMEAAAGHAAVHSHVVWAPRIADEITDWTRHSGGSLIVMATAGMSGTRRPLLGSVAARVARHATCPVLLVPFDARRGGDDHPAPKLDCVVTGTDFSAASLGAADWVASEFPPGVRQLLVHVVELPDAPAYARGSPEIRGRLMAEMREQGEIRLGHLFADALQTDRRVVVGRGPDELATAAVDADADLIVIGGHTHPRGLSSVLGTTAEQLIRCSPVPVLIVRGRPATAPRRILASVDGSSQSHHVLTWAKTLASKLDAALHVVHVLNPKFLGAAKLVSGMRAAHEMERSYEEQADRWLRELVTAAGIDPESCDLSLATGDAVYKVIALQQRSGADLLVVGSRGAGALGRTLIGSVSYAVIRGAMCPVLVVRGGEPDE
jgi:nucleotide-binding universal stress UspA family protein